jgi:hypothetical protein
MERYVKIKSTIWDSSSPVISTQLTLNDYLANTVKYLERFSLPQAIFDNSELHVEKANNFLLMKTDVTVEIKTNAEPFQQGALLLAYFPKSLSASKFRSTGNDFLGSITSAPHKVLYLEQGNKMEFTVPYAHIKDYLDLTDIDDTFGYVYLYALSELSGDSQSKLVKLLLV